MNRKRKIPISRYKLLPFGFFKVEGESMLPTFAPGDFLIGRRWHKNLKAGDIVVVRLPDRHVIKRIKKLNKDTVEIVGDNADASTDSRSYGAISQQSVEAKIIYRLGSTPKV